MAVTLSIDSTLYKRSEAPDRSVIDEDPDYQTNIRYDEYPMVVPKKRTALLVNRLMVALKDALEEDERERSKLLEKYGAVKGRLYNSDDIRTMDLQRRGHQSIASGQNKGHVYWRCYFNAVTCF
ncbi:hypothetical protein GWI33_003505 [Rhynchophorus ferrugineus]|uniref:Allatostatin CC n=3 Tax=Rhynchophorus ferrugineus TaxID=354439 RepID=A0A834M2Z3_RHYFE|nr:hypothetical protein GWI33_003505 [Rhynchophorus ferrugineus]